MKADNSVTDSLSTNCLFHGANYLSKMLRYIMLPSGFIYRQDKQTLQPKSMSKYTTFVSLLVNLVLPIRQAMFAFYSLRQSNSSGSNQTNIHSGHRDPNQSPVIYYTYYYLPLTVLTLNVSTWLFPFVLHHDSLVTILASNSYNLIDKQRQVRIARISFILVVINEIIAASGYLFFYLSSPSLQATKFRYLIALALALSNVYFRMNSLAPIMYLSYTGYVIGQNVKRFSQLYIENMLNTEEDENDETLRALSSKSLTTLLTTNTSSATNDQEDYGGSAGGSFSLLPSQAQQLVGLSSVAGVGVGSSSSSSSLNHLANIGGGSGHHPCVGLIKSSLLLGQEDATRKSSAGSRQTEMAPTKNSMALPSISSALASLTAPATVAPSGQLLIMAGQHLGQVGAHAVLQGGGNSPLSMINPNHSPFKPTNEMIFRWNNQLIRSRLRRTLKLLGQMKDDMIDLNRVVSPIFGAHLLSYAHHISYTASFAVNAISGTTTEDITMSIAVCLPLVLSFTIFVLQVCICFDSVPSELSLMMNRLFDAIVTNQSLKHQCNNQQQQQSMTSPLLFNSSPLQRQTGNFLQVKGGGGGGPLSSSAPPMVIGMGARLIPPNSTPITIINRNPALVGCHTNQIETTHTVNTISNNLSLTEHKSNQHQQHPSLFVNNLPMSSNAAFGGNGGNCSSAPTNGGPTAMLAAAARHQLQTTPQLLSAPSITSTVACQPSNMTFVNGGAINSIDDDELCDTWSQYQYARKLSGSIYFNLSGITPIRRRIVLSLFAHALSMLFILIELLRIYAPSQKEGQ